MTIKELDALKKQRRQNKVGHDWLTLPVRSRRWAYRDYLYATGWPMITVVQSYIGCNLNDVLWNPTRLP
jgi:hypothetical protein